METLNDLVAGTQQRLAITAASTFFTVPKITETVKNAHTWASGLYEWPHLEKAKQTVSEAGVYYYDYPIKLQTDSISRVIVDGNKYDLKSFDDFLNYKHQTTGVRNLRIAADFGRQVFIYPTPTTDNLTIILFGLEEVSEMVSGSSRTIFSRSESPGNEAVIKKALSVLLPQANKKKEGQAEESEAIMILANLYSKILKRQHRYQNLNRPRYNVPDMFGRSNSRQTIGNFNTD